MVEQSNSFQNRNSYIPPAVQKSMAAHMDRVMPAHLKQYQGSGAHMPARIEHEMTTQMQKNLPSHMQQYVEPYMEQKVVYGTGNSGSAQPLRQESAAAQSLRPVQTQIVLPNERSSRRSLRSTTSSYASDGSYSQGESPPNPNDDYAFIMNPGKPPKKPIIDLAGTSIFKRVLLIGGGLITLMIIASIVLSFFNSAGSGQKDRLLEIAQTQQEIIRVAEAAEEKIDDRGLLFTANSVRLSVISSQQDFIDALNARGAKKVEKRLSASQNSKNDALLVEGEQNGKFDETYRTLLNQQLSNYGLQLQAAFEGSNPSEQQAIEKAFDQLDLLLDKPETQP